MDMPDFNIPMVEYEVVFRVIVQIPDDNDQPTAWDDVVAMARQLISDPAYEAEVVKKHYIGKVEGTGEDW